MKKSIVILFLFVFSLSFSFTAANLSGNSGNEVKTEIKCPYLQSHSNQSGITCPYLREKMSKDHQTIQKDKFEAVPKCPYLERNKNYKSNGNENHPVIKLKSV
jgi:hypothetical protein